MPCARTGWPCFSAVGGEAGTGVRVHVDEPGRDDEPGGVDGLRGRCAAPSVPTAWMRSPVMPTSARIHGLPVAVDDVRVANQQVEPLRPCASDAEPAARRDRQHQDEKDSVRHGRRGVFYRSWQTGAAGRTSTPATPGLSLSRGQPMLRKLTWLYVAGFLGIFLICHTPGLTDADGPAPRAVPHRSDRRLRAPDVRRRRRRRRAGAPTYLMPLYFKVIGMLYDLDALVGMTMSRGLLDLSVFTQGPGPADFSLANWAINMPHIVLATLALWIGFRTWRDEPRLRPAPRLGMRRCAARDRDGVPPRPRAAGRRSAAGCCKLVGARGGRARRRAGGVHRHAVLRQRHAGGRRAAGPFGRVSAALAKSRSRSSRCPNGSSSTAPTNTRGSSAVTRRARFPYLGSIGQYWTAYDAVCEVTRPRRIRFRPAIT